MTGIDQVVFMNDPARRCQPLGVLIADEAVRASQAFTSLSLKMKPTDIERVPLPSSHTPRCRSGALANRGRSRYKIGRPKRRDVGTTEGDGQLLEQARLVNV